MEIFFNHSIVCVSCITSFFFLCIIYLVTLSLSPSYRYQMPLALVGLISSLALWDFFKFCSDKWNWDWHPVIRQVLVRIAQCGEFSNISSLNQNGSRY